jgi:hypothetical protein
VNKVQNFFSGLYLWIPNEVRKRPSDVAVTSYLIILVLSVWLGWVPPTVMVFSEAAYMPLIIISEIYLLVSSIMILISMLFHHRGRLGFIEFKYVERMGWWGVFAGSAALALSAIFFSPGQDMGWPTAIWTILSISALFKIILITGDRRSWTR